MHILVGGGVVEAHPLVEVVHRYIRGCNTGDVDLMASCFAPDIRVYFLHQPPVEGRDVLARFWREFVADTKARWTVDRVLATGSEAVLEWTMLWTPPPADKTVLMRGTDWFSFVQEQIEEIRQYYDVRGLVSDDQPYELQGFPYAERGYPTWATMTAPHPHGR
jgi:hypothetical protein